MTTHLTIVTGPAGVGKTSVLKKTLDALTAEAAYQHFYYVAGDSFAHINCPWVASDEQLDLKYEAMLAVLKILIPCGGVIFIDDVFRREQDLQSLVDLAALHGIGLDIILMDAPLSTLFQRNQLRESVRQVISEDKLLKLYEISHTLMRNFTYLELPNQGTIDDTVQHLLSLIPKGYHYETHRH